VKHSKASGLSLTELMLTVAVLAVLLTIALPNIGNFMQEQRVTSAANHLLTHLHYARNEAVFRRAHVAACPSLDRQSCTGGNRWDQGFIVFIDQERRGQPESPDDVLRVVQANDLLLMHSAGRTRVRFQPHGGAYGTNLTIRVCDQSQRATPRAVIVSNPGRIRTTRDLDAEECNI
jgi:type IV fimbrial biogenesis protein FimT